MCLCLLSFSKYFSVESGIKCIFIYPLEYIHATPLCNVNNIGLLLRAAPLRITLFPESSQVMEGERLTLVCAISSGDTASELRWTMIPSSWKTSALLTTGAGADRDEMTMIGGAREQIGGNVKNSGSVSVVNTDRYTSLLKIDRVTGSHAGQYFCDASSPAGRIFRRHNLTVLGTRRLHY